MVLAPISVLLVVVVEVIEQNFSTANKAEYLVGVVLHRGVLLVVRYYLVLLRHIVVACAGHLRSTTSSSIGNS